MNMKVFGGGKLLCFYNNSRLFMSRGSSRINKGTLEQKSWPATWTFHSSLKGLGDFPIISCYWSFSHIYQNRDRCAVRALPEVRHEKMVGTKWIKVFSKSWEHLDCGGFLFPCPGGRDTQKELHGVAQETPISKQDIVTVPRHFSKGIRTEM